MIKKNKRQVFAIVRWDYDLESPKDSFAVKEIVDNAEFAEQEVLRLNLLNKDKNVTYYYLATRFVDSLGG